jgi:diacylglycerol kinase family enzyme
MTVDEKRSALAGAAHVLDAPIHGLDTATAEELRRCAQELIAQHDVLVVAGGDGTFSDIINGVDTTRAVLAYLPLGSGNALAHALKCKGNLTEIAFRIRDGKIRTVDLIACDGNRSALSASVGIEDRIIRWRDDYQSRGLKGFRSYFRAVLKAYFRDYVRARVMVWMDDVRLEISDLLSLMVAKHPYYGYGMRVVPRARLDDRRLHVLSIQSGALGCLLGAVSAFTVGNRTGHYGTAERVAVKADRPLGLQIDGNCAREARSFHFVLRPGALRIKC